MWSGRFREPLDPHIRALAAVASLRRRLLPQEVAASKAHAQAIAAAGILTPAELETTPPRPRRHPRSPRHAADACPTSAIVTSDAEDIHHFVELSLTADIGDLALKLHTGRSRNEQIATDMRLFVRDAIDATVAQLTAMGSRAP